MNKDSFILFILGVLVFSSFGSTITMGFWGINGSFPEIFALPFLIFYRKKIIVTPRLFSKLIVVLIFWVILILISFAVNKYSSREILGSSRTYLTLFLSFIFFLERDKFYLNQILIISIGSIFGWILASIYEINLYLNGLVETISVTGNLLAIPLALAISLFNDKKKIFWIILILLFILSLISGMRRQIFISVSSIILIISILPWASYKLFKKYFKIGLLSTLLFVIIIISIAGFLKEYVPALHFRVIEKISLTFEGGAAETGDLNRLENMKGRIGFVKNFFPHGFVTRQTKGENDDGGGYIDFPLSELFYTFGFALTILFLIIFLVQIIYCFTNRRKMQYEGLIFFIVGLIIIQLLFIEGTFLSSSYVSPLTGYCLAGIKKYSKIKFTIGNSHKI